MKTSYLSSNEHFTPYPFSFFEVVSSCIAFGIYAQSSVFSMAVLQLIHVANEIYPNDFRASINFFRDNASAR